MHSNLLAVFAKYPEPGKVKTRLAAEIGAEAAATVYRACAEQVLAAVEPAGAAYDLKVACWPPERVTEMAGWLGPGLVVTAQQGADLGSRMHDAVLAGLAAGYTAIVVIGTDCPAVTHELIVAAFAALGAADVVLGPAADGGYYLIGLARPAPELFAGIPWSTALVFRETIDRCRSLQLGCSLLPELRDIDRADDLRFYRTSGVAL